MTSPTVRERLEAAGIRPSAQRLVIADFVLHTDAHPSADDVLDAVRSQLPMVSRATVYNTLNLFAEHGLLTKLALTEGRVVFDPKTERHHHLIDDEGRIHDVPWGALRVRGVGQLEGFEVDEHQVVLRGRRRS